MFIDGSFQVDIKFVLRNSRRGYFSIDTISSSYDKALSIVQTTDAINKISWRMS